MYGWLLESVQHFIVKECGEEIWETILREAGARNTVFSATQQYPDTLMLRLASELARLLAKEPNSPTVSTPGSPAPRKASLKSKPNWKSASIHNDGRTQGFKCPFTATNALTAATKKEIYAYTSSEEIATKTLSAEKINETDELEICSTKSNNRRSLAIKLEDPRTHEKETPMSNSQKTSPKETPKEPEAISPCSANSETKRSSIKKNLRKNSCTVVDVYKRRGSGAPARQRLNSLSLVGEEKLNLLRDKFSTPEKVMHFFGRCFVKFFSNYGYDTMIRATGRYFCTFLQSVDSIHQRMRFTFPRMRSPTMQLTRAHRHGAELVYSSGRTGFTHYLMGMIQPVDSIHQRMRFTFPRMRSPTMQLTRAHRHGAELVYSSGRTGFTHYLMGMIQPVDSIHQRMRFTFPRMRSPTMQLTRAHPHGAELVYSSGRTGFTHYLMSMIQPVDSIHQRMRFTFPRMRSPAMQLTRAHRHGAELVYSSGRTGFTHYLMGMIQPVDSIHQRMRFTFPRMRSPAMQLTRAHRHGAELVYSSGRTGFTHYLMGQLYEIAEDIFSLKLKVSVVKESMEGTYYVATLRLEFDNDDYVNSLMVRKSLPCLLPTVPVSLLLQLFPFGVLLDRRMKIMSAGTKLVEVWGGPLNRIEKSPVSDILRLRKPKVSFTWDKVVCMQTMLFELELMSWRARTAGEARRASQGARAILLKGPIYLLQEIDALIFMCSPIFNDLDELRQAGLCLADLNDHGLSRTMLLNGWQHLSRLELLFEKAESRSLSLEKSYRLLDQWKKRGDQLLYSMIPKAIADHLRAGKDPMAACHAYESVTVMFCGLQLAEVGTRADVMQTVAYMNDVYSRIDRLLDAHRVYKVETVGTVYMLVSGAPERRRAHAAAAASAALAIANTLPMLTVGVHSGPCVAGVLGLKLPRFCLVGDTVNTASRMQTSSEPGRIQISAQTASELPPGKFRLRRRGLIKVKGKGMMETFWLEGEQGDDDEQDEALKLFSALCAED